MRKLSEDLSVLYVAAAMCAVAALLFAPEHVSNNEMHSSAIACIHRGGVPVTTVLLSKEGVFHDNLIVCLKPEAVLR